MGDDEGGKVVVVVVVAVVCLGIEGRGKILIRIENFTNLMYQKHLIEVPKRPPKVLYVKL